MNELVFFINKVVIAGSIISCIYALGAVGVTLVFGILRFAHFAHGDLMTFAAFFALLLSGTVAGVSPVFGLPSGFVALPIAMILTAALAIGIDRLFYKPLRDRDAKPLIIMVASIGVMLMLQGLLRLIAGTSPKSFFSEEKKDIFRLDLPFSLADKQIIITEPQVLLIISALIAVSALHWYLTRTRMGKAMRAMSDNADLALITGINTNSVVITTWIIAGALAAAGGVLLSLDATFKADLSFQLLIPTFAAAIVGGIGRPYGAVVGGFIVGFAESLAVFNWSVILRPLADYLPQAFELPTRLTLVPTEYKIVVPFVILVAVLIWRPTGVLRGRVL